jgi:hypothetical protein
MKKDEKRSNVPLRDWASASYDPDTGRAAASSKEPQRSYSFDGEPCHPSQELPTGGGANGAPGFDFCDANRSRDHGAARKKPRA